MKPGKRTDLLEIKAKIDNGATLGDIADTNFSVFLQYRRGLNAYISLKSIKRRWKTYVIVLWGYTGVGKTRFVYDQCGDRELWTPGDYNWFDGYNGQELVLLDDYRGEYAIQFFLKLTDRYPMQVPVKGDFVNWNPKKIYITSNEDPDYWYKDADLETKAAFKRRLDQIHVIRKPIYDDIPDDIREF